MIVTISYPLTGATRTFKGLSQPEVNSMINYQSKLNEDSLEEVEVWMDVIPEAKDGLNHGV